MSRPYEVIGIGGPILDQILRVSETFLEDVAGGQKGGTVMVSYDELQRIIAESGENPVSILGGCARNIMHGMTRFGDACALLGMVGSGERGRLYRQLLAKQGIHSLLVDGSTPNAIVLSLVTPDGERSMRVFPGASAALRGEHLESSLFEGVRLVHLEGYMIFNEDLVESAMRLAQEKEAKVSFDLASFQIAGSYRDQIFKLLDSYVDIVFLNELEAEALTGEDEESTVDQLAELVELAIVTMGPRGCWVKRGDHKVHCPAYPIEPIDTTGAGDLFASGFLHAYLQGFPIDICAHYGAVAARAVVQTLGAEVSPAGWNEVYRKLKSDSE